MTGPNTAGEAEENGEVSFFCLTSSVHKEKECRCVKVGSRERESERECHPMLLPSLCVCVC